MEYKTKEKKGLLHVQVTFKPQTRDGGVLSQETKDVIEWVETNRPELKILKVLSTGRGFANNSQSGAFSNSWVFAVYNSKAAPKKPTAKKPKKTHTEGKRPSTLKRRPPKKNIREE